jgi:His-Xaa-Ser system protein HxsD
MTVVMSASGFRCGSDELGVFAQSSVDPTVFSETAILKTAYWFTDKFYVFLAKNFETGLLDIEFRLKQGEDTEQLKIACGEFSNYLLDQEVRQKVLLETSGIRDALIKKAFVDARIPPPLNTICNESYRVGQGQSYLQDPVRAGQTN